MATVEAAVLGGAAAATENRVFLLDIRGTRASICSAALLTPRMLLTAAHCVDPVFQGASTLTIRALNKPDTTNLSMADTTLVTRVTRHPMWNPADDDSLYDLATVVLASPIVNATPIPLGTISTAAVGQPVQVFGYGRLAADMPASSGTRRVVTATVNSVDATRFRYGTVAVGLCTGDSGGPTLLNGAVVGVHSQTEVGTCGVGIDIRVDVNRAFIDGTIAVGDPPLCTSDLRCAPACPSPDPDCPCAADGTCNTACGNNSDPDCRCRADGRCDSSCGMPDPDCTCVSDGACDATCGTRDVDCCRADGRCDAACGAADADCPDCTANSRCVRACGASDQDCVADGEACTTDDSCLSGSCASSSCARSCSQESPCPEGSSCESGACQVVVTMSPKTGCSTGLDLSVIATALVLGTRRARRTRSAG